MPAAHFSRPGRQKVSARGLLVFFLFALFVSAPVFFHAGAVEAAGSGQAVLLAANGESGASDAENGQPQAATGNSSLDRLFQGSFLGALLFGLPYQGIGSIDVALMAVAFLLILRVALRRRQAPEQDKFTVRRREASTEIPDDRPFSWPGKEESSGEQQPGNGRGPADAPPGEPGKGAPGQEWDWDAVMRKKAPGKDGSRGSEAGPTPPPVQQPMTMKDRAALMWKYYGEGTEQQGAAGSTQWQSVAPGVQVPPGFDVADFLEGARTLYIRLQKAWAARKVDELEPFVAPRLFELLKTQAARDPYPVQVDILLVDAELADVRAPGGREEVSVNFNVSMRSGNETRPQDIHELWRFARGSQSDGMWRLEGIEQP